MKILTFCTHNVLIHKSSYDNFTTKSYNHFLDVLWQSKFPIPILSNTKNFFVSIYKTSNSITLVI